MRPNNEFIIPLLRPMSMNLRTIIALAAGVLGSVLTLALGNWQTHRAEYKLGLQAQWDAALREPPLAVGAANMVDALHLPLRVRLTGTFRHQFSVWLDNRQMNGRAGFFVITPLETSSGMVLVNRGWVERDPQDRMRLPGIGAPAGVVTIEGIALAEVPRLLELGHAVDSGTWPRVWQNLDFAAFEKASGLGVARFVVQQTSQTDDGLARDWPAPDLGVEMHRGYAFQWYSLSVLIAGLTVFFGWREWRIRSRTSTIS